MQASIGQYSIHAGEPAQPVQQSVVIARMRGFFLRVALPSPTDMGQYFSTMSKMFCSSYPVMRETLTQALSAARSESANRRSPSVNIARVIKLRLSPLKPKAKNGLSVFVVIDYFQ